MKHRFQKGIFYQKKPFHLAPGNRLSHNDSFAVIFLRISESAEADQVFKELTDLWKIYSELQRGRMRSLPGQTIPSGGLSVLIGFGPNIFSINGVKKKIPRDFRNRQFLTSIPGGSILQGSGINYTLTSPQNLGVSEHIVFQFISRTQLATNRAVVETFNRLLAIEPSKRTLSFSRFYTGFQRDDGRSWLGFHDEVSNMHTPHERESAIFIERKRNSLPYEDFWTEGGTYLAFLRTEINLSSWLKLERKKQELIVGRDKISGRPLVGIDKEGNPVVLQECPPVSKLRSFDKRFYDHLDYFQKPKANKKQNSVIDVDASIRVLSHSHIGRTRHMDPIRSGNPTSRRIFRQGFEFVESHPTSPLQPLVVGLNFVSFQNDPGRIFFILTDPNWMGKSNFGGTGITDSIKNLLSVSAAGIFFVPHLEEPFPGAGILQDK